MFQGLSLEQAPPYKIPLRFYVTGIVYLLALAVLMIVFALDISSRFDYTSVALTHTLTLGFFTHIMFGSMFQMIPVMLGIAYKNVVRDANIIYTLVNLGAVLFIAGFLSAKIPLMHSGGLMVFLGFIYFATLSLRTVLQASEKDYLVKNFAASFALLFVAAVFGFIALLGHSGVVDSVKFGDIHIALMLFGWVFLLINAVSYRIIPMFFVAKEFPKIFKEVLYIAMVVLVAAFAYLRLTDNSTFLSFVKMALGILVVAFALMSIFILKNRKRARSDISVSLWHFSMANAIIAASLFMVQSFVGYDFAFFIAFFALFGAIFALMNAMLYKIVPFLTWFHLSSSMVFEAEMSEVIAKKMMRLQVGFYFASYVAFSLSFVSSWMVIAGSVLFLLSASLLLKNVLGGMKYYNKLIVKKPDFTI
ncbi:MAG: hypothetical protein FAF05_06650 [Epsilonproteobacteria bacterium]|nr:hypothetical protein [Campylobacterota bacterium]